MQIKIKGQHFELLIQKAILWKEAKTLLISDLHLGKIMHFRKSGIALPSIAYENNFKRLDELMLKYDVERILFLGDLFHNRYNEEWDAFAIWRRKYLSIEIKIVLGNHDILPRNIYESTFISVHNELKEREYIFTHHPQKQHEDDTYTFCGHIHPVYCLRSPAKQSIKLPCFLFDERQAILPSFGVFTGGYEMKDVPGRKIFVITDTQILAT